MLFTAALQGFRVTIGLKLTLTIQTNIQLIWPGISIHQQPTGFMFVHVKSWYCDITEWEHGYD